MCFKLFSIVNSFDCLPLPLPLPLLLLAGAGGAINYIVALFPHYPLMNEWMINGMVIETNEIIQSPRCTYSGEADITYNFLINKRYYKLWNGNEFSMRHGRLNSNLSIWFPAATEPHMFISWDVRTLNNLQKKRGAARWRWRHQWEKWFHWSWKQIHISFLIPVLEWTNELTEWEYLSKLNSLFCIEIWKWIPLMKRKSSQTEQSWIEYTSKNGPGSSWASHSHQPSGKVQVIALSKTMVVWVK